MYVSSEIEIKGGPQQIIKEIKGIFQLFACLKRLRKGRVCDLRDELSSTTDDLVYSVIVVE